MKHLVSVIIPNYNYSRFIGEAVESALSQSYQEIEVIVVDDGSKDNSLETLKSFGDRIKVIAQQNQGVSAARNNGVANSKGEYLAFLDADDLWLPEKIGKQIEKFSSDHNLGLVHVGVEDIDGEGNHLEERLDGLEGDISEELLLFKQAAILGGGSGIMISRKAFDEIGGFDPRLSTSADWDIFYQVSSRYKVGFIREVLLKYRVHGSNMHANIPRMEHEMRIGFEKAFEGGKVNKIKREAHGNLYQVLAASHFRAGNYSDFARNAVKSIWFTPGNLGYFAKYPIRLLRRKLS